MLIFIAPGLGHVTGMTLETAREIDYETFLLVNFWLAAALVAGVVVSIYLLLQSTLGLGMLQRARQRNGGSQHRRKCLA